MKKILYLGIAILSISISQANYEIKMKLDGSNSILFNSQNNPENEVPVGDGWVSYGMSVVSINNVGNPYDCTNWMPSTDDTPSSMTINQTRNCKQDKEGFMQEYYYNEESGEDKYVGAKTPFQRTDSTSLAQTVQGTGPACIANNKYQWVDYYDHPTAENIEFLRREILWNGSSMLAYNNDMVDESTTSYVLSFGGDYRYTKSTLIGQTSYTDSYWASRGKLNVYKHTYAVCRDPA